jgi:hypothetical protein
MSTIALSTATLRKAALTAVLGRRRRRRSGHTTLAHARLAAAGFKAVSVLPYAPPTPQSAVTTGTRAAA